MLHCSLLLCFCDAARGPMWSDLDGHYAGCLPGQALDPFLNVLPDGGLKEVWRNLLLDLGVRTYLVASGHNPN